MLADLFTDPEPFFETVAEEGELLRPPGVVLLVGLPSGIASRPASQLVSGVLAAQAGSLASLLAVLGAIRGLVGMFVGYLLNAGSFYAISEVAFEPDGSFADTLTVTGWGYVPAAFGILVSAAASFYVLGGMTVPSDPAQVQAFVVQLQTRPALQVAGYLGIAFLSGRGSSGRSASTTRAVSRSGTPR